MENKYENQDLILLEQYKNIVDSCAIVTKADINGNITYANDKFCKVSGYSLTELIGKSHNIIRHPDVPKSFYKNMWSKLQNKKSWFGKIKNKSKNGKTYYVDVLITPLFNEKNEITEYISLRYDISNILNTRQQLIDEIKSSKNPLLIVLQIKNYLNLKRTYKTNNLAKIKKMVEKRIINSAFEHLGIKKVYSLSNGRYAILKDFKNEFIKENQLKTKIKSFYTLLHLKDLEYKRLSQDIQMILSYSTEKKNIYENTMRNLSFMEEKRETFICCDIKNEINNRNYIHNITIIHLIKNALINNNIKSFYQPIICNKTNKIIKYESLIRINYKKEVITPNIFLTIAKESGYYYHITKFVLHNVFSDLRKTEKSISINISSLDIENIKFRTTLLNLLKNNKDIANRLTLEILEDENIFFINEIESFIGKVKSFGVKISIDDFGTGYSNFLRLKILKPDYLKIDGSLIQNIEQDKYSLDLVKTIQLFAKSQNILTIAEFVSDQAIHKIIKEIGIDYSQGYYFAKPSELPFSTEIILKEKY